MIIMNTLKTDQLLTKTSLKTTATHTNDPTIKGYLLNINSDINELREEVFEEQKNAENIQSQYKGLYELFKQQLDEVRGKIKLNLGKAKEEISNHLKRQEANNARLERHLKQLRTDNAELMNNLMDKKKRLDVIRNTIGPDEMLNPKKNEQSLQSKPSSKSMKK